MDSAVAGKTVQGTSGVIASGICRSMSGSHYRSGFLQGSDVSFKHVLRYGTMTLGGVVGHTGTGGQRCLF
jgi:citrate lyase alpha subunit